MNRRKAKKKARARPARTPADGRLKRGQRSKDAIVCALYDLIQQGNVQPAMEEVAARAGVGMRTVFRQFAHIDDLYRSLAHRLRDEVMKLVQMTPPSGVLATDVRALIARRARIFEYITPFRRAGRLVSHQSSFIREEQHAAGGLFRAAIEVVIGPSLETCDPQARAALIETIDLLLSFEAWDRLRDQQKLSVDSARAILANATILLVTSPMAAKIAHEDCEPFGS